MGRSFSIFSDSAITVNKISSETVCFFIKAHNICLVDLMSLSQTPPIWLAYGGLNLHSISFCNILVFNCCIFQNFISSLISLFPPWKLVPLSLNIISGFPLLLINLIRAHRNESNSSVYDTSICTDLVVKQVKRHPYLLTLLLPCFTNMGSK